MMRHNKITAIGLLLGAFLLLPSVALASFPDFGPFETQVRYLEAGFGIAQQFFNQAAGIGGGSKALQYLALTAALVGFIMVVLQKKNQALGVLIPWLIIVFIMLAGPYNSKLLFVSAKNKSVAGGQLEALLPPGLLAAPNQGNGSNSNQSPPNVGFTPQIVSIHVMSTLHRLFYDFFNERNIKNQVVGTINTQKARESLSSFSLSPEAIETVQALKQCGQTSSTTNSEAQGGDDGFTTHSFSDAVNAIKGYGTTGKDTERPPVAVLYSDINQVPGGQQNKDNYVEGIRAMASNLGVIGNLDEVDPNTLGTLVPQIYAAIENGAKQEKSSTNVADIFSSQTATSAGSLAFFLAPSTSAGSVDEASSAVVSRQLRMEDRTINISKHNRPVHVSKMELLKDDAFFKQFIGDPAIVNMPVGLAYVRSATVGSQNLEIILPKNCADQLDNALSAALSSGNTETKLHDDIINAIRTNTPLTQEQAKALTVKTIGRSNGRNRASNTRNNEATRNVAQYYLDLLDTRTPQDALLALREEFLIAGGVNSASKANNPTGFEPGVGNTFINGAAKAFVGLAKPVIQLLSPFIVAGSVLVLEMMKVIIDIAIMGVVVVTPLAFLMGLLIPSYALGVMTLMTLCVLVLKMVPVTFTIVDAILSIMFTLLEANKRTFTQLIEEDALGGLIQGVFNEILPTFEQTLLLFAAAGVYTGLVGLSLFILFKIGDPSSVSQLAALDNAAKSTAALAAKVGAVAIAGGAMAAKGALASNAGIKASQAAGDSAIKSVAGGSASGQAAVEALGDDATKLDKQKAFSQAFMEETGFAPGKDKFDEEGNFIGMSEEDAYHAASGGLDMNDPNKNRLSRALLTGGSQAGQMIGGAISSSLPGGGGALMKEISNAGTEGRAQSEARLAAEAQNKSFSQVQKEAEIQGYRGQYAGILGSSAAFGGTEAGIAGSGAMSSAMMSHAIDGGKSQAGQEMAGMWAHEESGHMSAKDYQVAHSLQARQSAADLKQASVANAEISGAGIEAKAKLDAGERVRDYDKLAQTEFAAKATIAEIENQNNLKTHNEAIEAKVNAKLDELTSDGSRATIKAELEAKGLKAGSAQVDDEVQARALSFEKSLKASSAAPAKLSHSDISDDKLLKYQRQETIHEAYQAGSAIANRFQTEAKYAKQKKVTVSADGKTIEWGGASLEQHFVQADMDAAPGVSGFLRNYATTKKLTSEIKAGNFSFDAWNINESDKQTAAFVTSEMTARKHIENPEILMKSARIEGARKYRSIAAKADPQKEFYREVDEISKDSKVILKREAQAVHKKWAVEVETNPGVGARGVADSFVGSVMNEARSIVQDKYKSDSNGKHLDVQIADSGASKMATSIGLQLYSENKGKTLINVDGKDIKLDKPGNMILMRDANGEKIYDAAFAKMKKSKGWTDDTKGRPILATDLLGIDIKQELSKPQYNNLINQAYETSLQTEEGLRGERFSSKISFNKNNKGNDA